MDGFKGGTAPPWRKGTQTPRKRQRRSSRALLRIGDDWRLIDDPYQWILQRHHGKWRSDKYLTSRRGVHMWVKIRCGEELHEQVKDQIDQLPERKIHPRKSGAT